MTIDLQLQDVRHQDGVQIPGLDAFKQWSELVVKDRDVNGALVVRLVDVDEIRQLNSQYRGKDKPTNVLSFTYNDYPEDYIGDIIMAADIVDKEASERGVPTDHHWAHLTIHGLLHLLGYDHEDVAQAEEMEKLEIDYLQKLGISDPYVIKE